ncbi:hypothetical protein B0I37DRAFT_23631 [Chaetomium sp. MPI-CAGE-AT-0009]|nr:hypothetical protein B0I37DRAFT_23631 [Chaetomium sp. MPI-CAGE-AT-0009]
MGFLDDAASVISGRTSHSKRSKSHRSSRRHHKERSHSHERSRSRHRSSRSNVGGGDGGSVVGGAIGGIAASIFGGDDDNREDDYHRHSDRDRRRSHHHESRRGGHSDDDDGARSFFGVPNTSRGSFFSNFGGRPSHSSSSHYRRSPRPGFIARLLKKLKRLFRDLVYYAKRHPTKVFMLVLMPLITGGALTALLARVGLRLPPFVERLLGVAARAGSGDSLGLVGEAVRMVSGAAGGASLVKAGVERGREGGVRWERRSLERDFDGFGGGGGGGWSDGLKSITKIFS